MSIISQTFSKGVILSSLLIPALAFAEGAPAKRSGEQTLTPDQKEAVHSIILGLETLKADPQTAGDTIKWIQEQVAKSSANLTETRSEIERLRAEIEAIRKKKEELETRLNALAVARTLLSEAPAAAPATTPAVQTSEPAPQVGAPKEEPKPTPAPEAAAPAAPVASEVDLAFFKEKVYPILEKNCFGCHGPEKQKNGLRLDSLETAKKGGDYGPAVVPGDTAKSLLVEVINYQGDVQMPPKEKLADDEIAVLTDWIQRGAPWGS